MKTIKVTLFLFFVLIAPSLANAEPILLPLKPHAWRQFYNSSSGAYFSPAPPLKVEPDGNLGEIFPVKTDGVQIRYNYLLHGMGGRDISKYHSITYTIAVKALSGTPVFEFLSATNRCHVSCYPVAARLLLWGPPDGDLSSVTNRWWAWASAIPLAPGTFTVTVSLDPSDWTGVQGRPGVKNAGFALAKAHVYALGMTFGGGWHYSHGTDTKNGKALFKLIDYRLE